MDILFSMHQHQGDRDYQQDAMKVKSFGDLGALCVLADGMGGYEGGEIASDIIASTFFNVSIDGDDIAAILERTLHEANDEIARYKETHPEVGNMGSTLIAAFFTDNSLQWISVGDSPLYEIADNRRIQRINDNHSVAGILDLQLKQGEITQQEVDQNPNKHMLTSAVNGEEIAIIDLSPKHPFEDDHLYILASDGIETLSEQEILRIVQKFDCGEQEGLSLAAQQLVIAVLEKRKPKQDNVTVVLVSKKGMNGKFSDPMDDTNTEFLLENNSPMDKKKVGIIIGLVLLLAILLWQIVGMVFSDPTPPTPNPSPAPIHDDGNKTLDINQTKKVSQTRTEKTAGDNTIKTKSPASNLKKKPKKPISKPNEGKRATSPEEKNAIENEDRGQTSLPTASPSEKGHGAPNTKKQLKQREVSKKIIIKIQNASDAIRKHQSQIHDTGGRQLF